MGHPEKQGPLVGTRVIDLSRLSPGPYCSMLLADLGADVIAVGGGRAGLPIPELLRGKRCISLNLKDEAGRTALRRLVVESDVVIEGFRPGVAGKIGAGYDELSQLNPRLVYCSVTGYGQSGPLASAAGHDINYVALSGTLGAMGPAGQPPVPPLNLVADFAGGGLVAAFGIVSALLERNRSGVGQYIDTAMVDGAISMMAMHFPIWGSDVHPDRGLGVTDGAAPFYRCYECADGRYVAVGAFERHFFESLWGGLGLGDSPDHMDRRNWPHIEQQLAAAFLRRTRDEWQAKLPSSDTCVTPVLSPDEVFAHPHMRARHGVLADVPVVPRLARTPGRAGMLAIRDETAEVLGDLGLEQSAIEAARDNATVTGLVWPPPITAGSG